VKAEFPDPAAPGVESGAPVTGSAPAGGAASRGADGADEAREILELAVARGRRLPDGYSDSWVRVEVVVEERERELGEPYFIRIEIGTDKATVSVHSLYYTPSPVERHDALAIEEKFNDFPWTWLTSISDWLREARETIDKALRDGYRVKVITNDERIREVVE